LDFIKTASTFYQIIILYIFCDNIYNIKYKEKRMEERKNLAFLSNSGSIAFSNSRKILSAL